MSSPKLASARSASRWLVVLAALALGGCGAVKVQPTAQKGSTTLVSRGSVDSPLTNIDNHLGCLQQARLPVQVVNGHKLQIGTWPSGPTVVFTATPQAAQADQIQGQAQAAEVIGSALLYPNGGSRSELTAIETCLDQGVTG